jgi:putative tryptophan/tyrosine transport system substrate-binding protein
MKRREFVTLIGSAAAWPIAARAQQSAKLPTIGYLGASTPADAAQWTAAFTQRLRELGWVEGRTVAIEYRWGEARSDRWAEITAEFVRLKVDVIAAYNTPTTLTAKKVTSVIPIVFALAGDPVGSGLVASLANRAVMSPACRHSTPIFPESDSHFCARLSLAFAGWP